MKLHQAAKEPPICGTNYSVKEKSVTIPYFENLSSIEGPSHLSLIDLRYIETDSLIKSPLFLKFIVAFLKTIVYRVYMFPPYLVFLFVTDYNNVWLEIAEIYSRRLNIVPPTMQIWVLSLVTAIFF